MNSEKRRTCTNKDRKLNLQVFHICLVALCMLIYNFEDGIFVQRNLDWDKDEDLSNRSSLIKNLNEKLKTNNVLEQLKPIFGTYLQ